MGLEILKVSQEYTTLDLLLWRRFGVEVPKAFEKTLARNTGVAEAGPFLPVGMEISVEVDDFVRPASTVTKITRLW